MVDVLAQLVDLFDHSTWSAIFAVGFGCPALSILAAGLVAKRVEPATIAAAVIYYVLAAVVWLSATDDSLISVLMLFAALGCGPVLAIAMAFINWRERRPSSVNLPTHGFPIEPIEHKSDR